MITMIFISSVAMLVGVVGSFLIWRFDAFRAEEIRHTPARATVPALPPSVEEAASAIGRREQTSLG